VSVIVLDVAVSDVFSERLSSWRDYTSSPWGRVRYAVVEETLRREASRLGTKLRILDVGGGDDMDALRAALVGVEDCWFLCSSRSADSRRTRAVVWQRIHELSATCAKIEGLGRGSD
jgi:S-adenosylmethionine-dependent methyltransferase